jgi:hypothetical protein
MIADTTLKSSVFHICGNYLQKHTLPWKYLQFRTNLYA